MEFWDNTTIPSKPVDIPKPRPSARILRLEIVFALVVADTVAIFSTFAAFAVVSDQLNIWETWIRTSLVSTSTYLVVAFLMRAYSHEVIQYVSKSMNRTVKASVGTATVMCFACVLLGGLPAQSLTSYFIVALAAMALLLTGRWFLEKQISRHYKPALFDEVLVLDGIYISKADGFRTIDARERGIIPNPNDPMMRHWAALYLAEADRVVVVCPPNKYYDWASFLKGSGIRVEIVMPELNDLGALTVSNFGQSTTVGISNSQLSLQNRILKRAFDIFFALTFLILAFPISVLCALLIKLDDGGPIFFVQQRMGRGNRLFSVIKFRSMTNHNTKGVAPQITRIGRVLRSLSLDELPQLLNVLSGQMSLVGPRPHALESQAGNQFFWEVDNNYWNRHAIKPGITGLAQVRGYRGTTKLKSDLEKRLQSDLEYLNGWSVWRDLAILCSTARVMVHKNAN